MNNLRKNLLVVIWYVWLFTIFVVNVQIAVKVERLIKERNRIIAEHDDGQIFIEDGKIVGNGDGDGGGDGGGKPSDSASKVCFNYH